MIANPNSSAAVASVCSSSSALTLSVRRSHGTMSRPSTPAKTTKAPNPPRVAARPPPPAPPPSAPSATTEFKTVNITTATTSSNTDTPIASCPWRS